MYILYGGPFTRAQIVELVLAEGEIPYEIRSVDILAGEHRAPAYLAVNPAGWVPALITPDGVSLYETPAINLYLAERHELTELAPRVDEPERGLFLSGLFYLTDEFEPAMKRYFYPHRYVLRSVDAQAMKHKSLGDALERLELIDRRLEEAGPYHLGARFSLVDLTLTYWAIGLEPAGRLESLPAVRRCMNLVMDRPKLAAKFADCKAARDEYTRLQDRGEGAS